MLGMDEYLALFVTHMESEIKTKDPVGLYEPIDYILKLGGKRIRPICVIIGAELFAKSDEEWDKKRQEALTAALAIEVFHNFTLVHDDIMDKAPIRRGKPTVHHKWNLNQGILSGDTMQLLSYQLLEAYDDSSFKNLMRVFTQTAIEVCEGQQLDIDFESRDDVKEEEYLMMIKLKTSVLLGCALKMGAIIGGWDAKALEKIYTYGTNVGLAFQIQDDYLDCYAESAEDFGKQVGGDIIENKKTILYIKAVEALSQKPEDAGKLKELTDIFRIRLPNSEEDKIVSATLLAKDRSDSTDAGKGQGKTGAGQDGAYATYTTADGEEGVIDSNAKKIEIVKKIFVDCGAADVCKQLISDYTYKAFEELEGIEGLAEDKKQFLVALGKKLMKRTV